LSRQFALRGTCQPPDSLSSKPGVLQAAVLNGNFLDEMATLCSEAWKVAPPDIALGVTEYETGEGGRLNGTSGPVMDWAAKCVVKGGTSYARRLIDIVRNGKGQTLFQAWAIETLGRVAPS
jgi:hypothetical protein